MIHKLDEYPMPYEDITEDLMAKIKRLTRSFKLKATKTGWVAQIRPVIDGERKEISEVAQTPREAVQRLDHTIQRIGLYDKG